MNCWITSASTPDISVQLIQRKTYDEINELFPKGQIDLAFICTGPYAAWKNRYGFEALATPQVRGQPFYQSYLIVPKESSYQRLEDLKGRVFRVHRSRFQHRRHGPPVLARRR